MEDPPQPQVHRGDEPSADLLPTLPGSASVDAGMTAAGEQPHAA